MNPTGRNNTQRTAFRPGSVEERFGRMVEGLFQDLFAPLAQGADLTGVKKEDVRLAIDGQRDAIEGECRQANEQRQGEQVVYAERSTRKYRRSFMLPADVDDAGARPSSRTACRCRRCRRRPAARHAG